MGWGLVGTFCNCINLNNGSKSLLLYNIHFIVQIRGHQTFCKASGSEYFGFAGKQALAPIQFHLAAQRQPQATQVSLGLNESSLVAQLAKDPPAMWEAWVHSLGWEDPLEKGRATHSSILAWRIPRTV